MSAQKTRDDIAEQDKWDLNGLFESDADWELAFEKVDELVTPVEECQGKLAESAEQLARCIEADDTLERELDRLYTYAHLRSDEDTSNGHYMAMQNRIKSKYIQISASLSWITPEILKIDDALLAEYMATEALKPYHWELVQLLRDKPHTLSRQEEKLLSMASEPLGSPSNTFSLFNNADLEFPEVENTDGEMQKLTHGNFIVFLESTKREVRRKAFEAVYDTYGSFRNTLASTLEGNVKTHIFNAKARNYESALKASLHGDNVEQTVYDSLIDAVHEQLPQFYKYVDLRARCLDQKPLDMYDQYAPIVPDFDLEVSWEQAQEWVTESVAPLGDEYAEIMKKAFTERWIDIYESKGKRSGAYSSGCYDSNPYILMNYQPNLNSVFTLAHELGHSMHSYFSKREQPHIYSGYTIFVAEVASTTNEGLLFDYLMKKTDDPKLKAYLLNEKCDGFKGTVYRQTMFAEFEKLIHEKAEQGVPLTADELCQSYYELNKKFYGDAVDADQRIEMEWARIPHFYYNFYVYKYATGFSAAEAFTERILNGDSDDVERYLGFLKAGGSKDPLDILSDAGVDLREKKVITDALNNFGDYITQLDDLLNQ